MKIGEEEVQKAKEVKKEQDREGSPSTTDPGEEETRRREETAPPVEKGAASASSGQAPVEEKKDDEANDSNKLRLPPWDESGGKKRSRMDRSPSRTPVHEKDEETNMEDVAKKHEEERTAGTRTRRGKDAESAGCGEMLTYTDSMFDELVMETQRFEQKYKGENNPIPTKNNAQGCPDAVSNVVNECVEVPSTPTNCSGLSTPIQQQIKIPGQDINKAIISPLSQGSRRKRSIL